MHISARTTHGGQRIDGALHRYLDETGHGIDHPVTIQMPVNLRQFGGPGIGRQFLEGKPTSLLAEVGVFTLRDSLLKRGVSLAAREFMTPGGGAVLTADELGQAFGRDAVVHAVLEDGGASNRVIREARRLDGIRQSG